MPNWLRRALRMGIIGLGATMLMSAVVNFIAIEKLFDASVENELGVTKSEMRAAYYLIGGLGAFLVTLGAILPLPKLGAKKRVIVKAKTKRTPR